jgi:hypothetical protein
MLDRKSRQERALRARGGNLLHKGQRVGDAEYLRLKPVTAENSLDLLAKTE